MPSSRLTAAFVLIAIATLVAAACNTISPGPGMIIDQVSYGNTKIIVKDSAGNLKITNKASINWGPTIALPGGDPAQSADLGTDDSLCQVNTADFGVYCASSGSSIYTALTMPFGVFAKQVDCSSYAPYKVVFADFDGNAYKYGTSTFSVINNPAQLFLKWVSVAADGTIWGLTNDGSLYKYDSGTTWNLVYGSTYNFRSVSAGLSENDLTLVSDNSGFPVYRKTSSGLSQVGSGYSTASSYNGYAISDTQNVAMCT